MNDNIHAYPRLFVCSPLASEEILRLEDVQAHYLRTVLRLGEGAPVRLFNGQDGEWLGCIVCTGKKQADMRLEKCLRPQPAVPSAVHLLFAPVKKHRLDILIEKAVELGVSALHPVLTDRTEARHIRPDKLEARITEAAEQCERLDVPALAAPVPLKEKISRWQETPTILWCAERHDSAPLLGLEKRPCAFLTGPEGGFSEDEDAFLSAQTSLVRPVSLGPRILRAETAALFCLSRVGESV